MVVRDGGSIDADQAGYEGGCGNRQVTATSVQPRAQDPRLMPMVEEHIAQVLIMVPAVVVGEIEHAVIYRF